MLYNTVLFGKMVPARLAICPEKLIANGFGNAYKYKFMILIEARLGFFDRYQPNNFATPNRPGCFA